VCHDFLPIMLLYKHTESYMYNVCEIQKLMPGHLLGERHDACFDWLIDSVGFNIPLNTLQVISGMGFYGSNDPTDSVKALKEVVVLSIGFNPTRSTSLCYKPTQYTCMQYIHKNESKHSEMGPVKQNPIQRTVRSVHVCVHCTVHNCCTHYCTKQTR